MSKQRASGAKIESRPEMAATSQVAAKQTAAVEKALTRKRDVIVIGAGLSGK